MITQISIDSKWVVHVEYAIFNMLGWQDLNYHCRATQSQVLETTLADQYPTKSARAHSATLCTPPKLMIKLILHLILIYL